MRYLLVTLWVLLAMAVEVQSFELEQSPFELESQKLKYSFATSMGIGSNHNLAIMAAAESSDSFGSESGRKKSPFKAFLLSIAVPGLGQYYYGSRVKPFVFLGAEIAAWTLHAKWHGDGDEATDAYEAFSRDNWERDRYEHQYLLWAYGVTDDDLAAGVTHHLPDTETQQYFEMTGKYNQFAWGWNDATRNGNPLEAFSPVGAINDTLKITGDDATIPYSAKRFQYEDMRHDANRKYDRATKMIIASIVNRLVSGFEAYFVTKSRNNKRPGEQSAFSHLGVRPSLKSVHEPGDTPYLKLAYRF